MELSGCPRQSQLIHLDARCTAVDVDSKQPDITVCREISPNSVGTETSSEETLSSCMLSSPARRDTDNSEDNTETPVVEFDEGYTAGHVDSKQPDITVCKEISPNSVGAETSSEETLSSFMLSSPSRHDTINSEDNTETHVVDFVEGRNAVHVHSKQPDITVCRESSQNSLGTETSLEETLASCRLSLPARQDTTNSEDNSETPVADRNQECADVKVDPKQAGIPTCSDISFDSVILVWDQPQRNANAIQYYEVKYKIHEEKKWSSVDTGDKMNTFRIEGLKSNTAYDFRVRAVYDDDGDEDEAPLSSICQNIKTKEQTFKDHNQPCADVKVDPKQAGIPTCSDISFDSVTLVWDQPQRNANAIQYYEVKYKIHEEKKWSSVDTEDKMNTFRIEGLKSNTAYDFRVRAVYDDDGDEDEAPLSSICQNIKTKEQTFKDHNQPCADVKVDPKQAGIPTCSDISFDSVTLVWDQPQRNSNAIQYYEVKYKIHEEKKWSSVDTEDKMNTFRIEGLKSNTAYDFRVRSVYDDDGDEDEAPLSSICQNIKTKEQTFKDHNQPCADVKVDPKQAGIPTCSDISFDSVTLVWDQPQRNSNAIQYYEVKYKIHEEKKWSSVDTEDKMNTFRIEGLKSNTAYDFRVRAVYDDDGDEDEAPLSSICQNIKTKEQTFKDHNQPCADVKVDPKQAGIPTCSDISFDSVTLVWDQPQRNANAIQYYEVKYKIHEEKKWSSVDTEDKMNTFRIEGLKSNTAYDFRVRAVYDDDGDEDEAPLSSICQNIKTKEQTFKDHNQPCADVKVDPKQAGIPTCSDISFDSVTLVWDQPQRNSNAIQYYEVKYKIHEEKKWSNVDTEDKMNTYRIEGLKSNTAYDFRVRAVYDDDGDEDEAPLSSICQNIKTKEQTFKGPISTPCQNIVKREPSLRELQIGVKNPSDCKPTIQRLPLTVKQNSVNSQAKSRKYLFGKRSPGSFREKTVMVMGGTGAGKSTMINSVVNHIMDVQWEDHTRLSVIELSKEETENSIDESISQTEWITCYTIPEDESKLDYTLNIIDTPGFGDTRGIDRDRELVDHLRVFFNSSGEQGVEVLNAVWFVVKASDTRLTHSEKYVFDSILSIFGKDIEKSIFVLATFADNKNPPVLNTLRKAQVPFKNAFVFNNSALFMNQEDHEENACGQHYWTRNTESFRQLFDVLGKTEKHSIQLSAEVLNIRRQLEVTIQGMHTHIHDGLTKMDRIKQEKNIVKNHETNVSANKLFEYDVTEEYKEMIDITGTGQFVTNCLKCNRTCHWPCAIAKDEDKASCSAMMNGYCTVCTDKCYWDVHRNTPERYEVRLATVKKTYEDVKQRYINEQKKVQTHQTLLDSLKQDYKETEKNVSSSITRARESLNRLKEIALKEDPLSHVEYIDMLITCEKRDKKERFLERVDMLEAIKQKAKLLANLSDVNPLTSFLDQC